MHYFISKKKKNPILRLSKSCFSPVDSDYNNSSFYSFEQISHYIFSFLFFSGKCSSLFRREAVESRKTIGIFVGYVKRLVSRLKVYLCRGGFTDGNPIIWVPLLLISRNKNTSVDYIRSLYPLYVLFY